MSQGDDQQTPDPGRIRHVIRYRVDNLLSRGTWAVLLWLAAITAAAVVISSALLAAFGVTFSGSESGSWVEDVWQSLLRTLDTGTMAADSGWGPRVLALIITIFGVLIAGTLIGLIASGVEQRVDQMQRGRSTVVESDHIVILGASSRLPVVVEQLAIAGRHRRGNTIVVLADHDTTELREAVGTGNGLHRSRLVIRSGQTDNVSNLTMVNVKDARGVIVVADEHSENDADVVTSVLAVGAAAGGFGRMPIVAELREPDMAQRLVRACGDSVHPMLATLAIARLTSFTLRRPGLREVLEELLDARGCCIFVREIDGLAGVEFGETVRRFADARPIGMIRADGTVDLNPPSDRRTEQGDRLIVIADDADSAVPGREPFAGMAPQAKVAARERNSAPCEHVVVVGWNGLGATLVSGVGQFSRPGSTVEIAYDPALFTADELGVATDGDLEVTLTPSERLTWELGPEDQTRDVTSIVLLGYRRGLTAGEADSRTLLSLMLLRQELDRRSGTVPRIVVELRDADNVDLARVSGADDYIVSDAVTSRLLTQLAEQPERRAVLLSLYAPEGPSFGLVDAAELGLTGRVRFDHIVATAQASRLLAVGWRGGPGSDTALVMNPHVSRTVELAPGDQIVVID